MPANSSKFDSLLNSLNLSLTDMEPEQQVALGMSMKSDSKTEFKHSKKSIKNYDIAFGSKMTKLDPFKPQWLNIQLDDGK